MKDGSRPTLTRFPSCAGPASFNMTSSCATGELSASDASVTDSSSSSRSLTSVVASAVTNSDLAALSAMTGSREVESFSFARRSTED